jgi:hypothetical protein
MGENENFRENENFAENFHEKASEFLLIFTFRENEKMGFSFHH